MSDKKRARPRKGPSETPDAGNPPSLREHKRAKKRGRGPGPRKPYGPQKPPAPDSPLGRDRCPPPPPPPGREAEAEAKANRQAVADGWIRKGVRGLGAAAATLPERVVLLAATHETGHVGIGSVIECDSQFVLAALGRLVGEVNAAFTRDGVKVHVELRMRPTEALATQNPLIGVPGGRAK